MKLTLILSSLFISCVACALSTGEPYKKRIAMIIAARSKAEMQAAERAVDQYEEVRSECTLELDSQKMPIQCFKQIDIEKSFQLMTSIQYKKSRALLSKICEARLLDKQEDSTLEGVIKSLDPRLGCVIKARGLLVKKEYQDIELHPRRLFESIGQN